MLHHLPAVFTSTDITLGVHPCRTMYLRLGPALETLVPSDVGSSAIDLLRKTLDININLRLSAQGALDHDFFSDCPELPTRCLTLDSPTIEEEVNFR